MQFFFYQIHMKLQAKNNIEVLNVFAWLDFNSEFILLCIHNLETSI